MYITEIKRCCNQDPRIQGSHISCGVCGNYINEGVLKKSIKVWNDVLKAFAKNLKITDKVLTTKPTFIPVQSVQNSLYSQECMRYGFNIPK
jgi:hypothetical protein